MMYKVGDKLWRGPRPASFQDLKDLGVDVCITLQSGAYEEFHDDHFEAEIASDFGIEQVCIPCSDITAPKDHEVLKFLRSVDKAKLAYVHCLHGKDRTGFMCAVYRMQIQAFPFKNAVSEMFSFGFHKLPYLLWLPKLKKWEKR